MDTIKTWQERMPKPRTQFYCEMNCSGPRPCPAKSCGDCSPYKEHGDPVAARDAEIAELRARPSADGVIAAVRMLVKGRGRFHTEQNYKELVAALALYDETVKTPLAR